MSLSIPVIAPLPSASLTLVSHHLCPYVQRAAIALAEKAVPFERSWVDLADKPSWFSAVSPLGKVPLLMIDVEGSATRTIFESAVILEYLEETQPNPLHPRDPVARALERSVLGRVEQEDRDIAGLDGPLGPQQRVKLNVLRNA